MPIVSTTTFRAIRAAAIYADGPPRFVFDNADGERIYVEMQADGYANAAMAYRAHVSQAAHAMGTDKAPWGRAEIGELAASLLSVMDSETRADVIAQTAEQWHTPRVTVEPKA